MTTRLRSRLKWKQATVPASAGLKGALRGAAFPDAALRDAALRDAGVAEAKAGEEEAELDIPMAARERAIAFLHLGSEIEHALMVQYLYAAYSLDENQASDARRKLVVDWRGIIAEIAREEMGHLATVQNLLTLIGGPLCFDREDYPIVDWDLWPFPLELEPLTKSSLAKYVLAEMPSAEVLEKLKLTEEIEQIKRRLSCTEGLSVNRVGLVYGKLLQLFTEGPMMQGPLVPGATKPYPFVAAIDIQADSLPYQVSPSAWGLGYQQILIETALDRKTALAALTKVSVQGEGPISADDDAIRKQYEASHFRRFLDIYRAFPEPSEWSPARRVATNPTTNPGVSEPSRRVRGPAEPWAALANLRYRMLLLYLQHSFYIEAPTAHPTRSPRGALVSWAFGEMYNLRSLSEILMTLPIHPGSEILAGPPFEMPYNLALPSRSTNRWRMHRDLLTAAIDLVGIMLEDAHPQARYLRALRAADETARDQIAVLVGA